MKIPTNPYKINEFLAELQTELIQLVGQRIDDRLETEASAWLHREYHERRQKVKRQTRACCQRCGSCEAGDFSRNGHRKRQMVSSQGVVNFWLPRVVCQCGGSVRIPFSIVQPYQRWWHDVLEQMGRWAEWGVSLRQMQREIEEQLHTSAGLRKLNTVVQTVATVLPGRLKQIPPIVMLDAIWVTLLEDTETIKTDRRQRRRRVKARQKVCVLVALGLFPKTGDWGILGWHVANGESQSDWEDLLLPLEQRGVYRQKGVELFIHEGGNETHCRPQLPAPLCSPPTLYFSQVT